MFTLSNLTLFPIEITWQKQFQDNIINKIIFNKTESMLITCGYDKKIRINNASNGDSIQEFSFQYNVYDVALMPDTNQFLVCQKHMNNSSVSILDIISESTITEFNLKLLLDTLGNIQNKEFIEVHAVPIDEDRILTGIGVYYYIDANHYYRGRLDLWNSKTGEWINEVFDGGMINNLVISPNGQNISFSTIARTSEFMEPWVYKEIEETKLFITDTSFSEINLIREDYDENMEFADTEVINDITFSNDSRRIALVTDNHHLFVYDVQSGNLTDSLFSCDCYADQSVDFVYDGNHLISGSNNGKVYIWNLEIDARIDNLSFEGSPLITSIASSKTNNLYAVADIKGQISLMKSWYINSVSEQRFVQDFYTLINCKNEIELLFKDAVMKSEFKIYNTLGCEISDINFQMNNNQISFDIASLVQGVYIISGTVNGKIFSAKFIKTD